MVIHFQLRASTPSSLGHLVRLACLRHAASVYPEPGSNSPKKIYFSLSFFFPSYQILTFCSVFKEHFFFFFALPSSAIIIYHLFTFVSTLFFTSLCLFFKALLINILNRCFFVDTFNNISKKSNPVNHFFYFFIFFMFVYICHLP